MTEQLSTSPAVDAGDAARAEMYVLLGTLLAGPPDEATLEMLLEIDAGEAGATPMTALWKSLQDAARATDSELLSDEYFNLFIGLGRGELVPYASFYIHGFLMEKVLASLREELAGLGIERQANVAEPEDHAAAVCEIMGMIISEHGLHLKQAAFFKDYIDLWLGHFFADLGKAEAADFYRAVAQLGQQFLAVEQRYFSLPE